MQNLSVGISFKTIFEDKGVKLATSSLKSLKSVSSGVFSQSLKPKTNLSSLEKLKSSLKGIKTQIQNLNSQELKIKARANMDSFKSSIMEKIALGASIVIPIKAAIDFESAMADVNKVVGFDSTEELKEFGAEIRNLSKTIPLIPTELAKITTAGGQLGVAKESLMDFTTLVAKMSTAFDMSAEMAGDSMAKIMNVYNLPLEEMESIGDAINHISDNSAAKAGDIVNVLGRIGGTSQIMGLSAKNAAALGSAFLAMGKAPEVASTAINSFFNKLLTPEEQSAGFKRALEEIGYSAEDLKDSIQQNPQKAIEDFLTSLTKVEKADTMGVLSNLFGAQFSDDIALLVTGIDKYKQAVILANTTENIGSLQREFETRSATTANSLILLKSSFINLGISIAQVVLPTLNALIDFARPLIDGITSFTQKFPMLTKFVVGSAVALSSLLIIVPSFMFLLSAMTLGLGKVVIGFKALSTAVLSLSRAFLLNPIGLAVTAIAMSVFAIYKYWSPLKEYFSSLLGEVAGIFEKFWENIKSGFSFIFDVLKALKSIFGTKNTIAFKEERVSESLSISPIKSQKSVQNNISVSFNGGINVQSKDGKIIQNSQLQRDIQKEVEMALKNIEHRNTEASFSDISF